MNLERNKSIIVIKQVSASICENCGEYTFEESVTNIAEGTVFINANDSKEPEHTAYPKLADQEAKAFLHFNK